MDNATTSQQKQAAKRSPFCFQEKHILRAIRDVFEKSPGLKSSAIAFYTALTEIASDYESDAFAVSQTTIANRAGLTDRTVRNLVPVFQKLGAVTVTRNYVDGLERQSTYRLNRGTESCGKIFRTPGKRFQNRFPTLEESLEESPDDNVQQSSSIPSLEQAEKDPLWKPLIRKFRWHCESKGGSPTEKGWQTWASEKVTTPTRTKHNVTVKREVRDDDEYFPRIYTMSVDSAGIDFYCINSALGMPHSLSRVKFRGTDGQNALSAFNTFSQ